MMIIPQQWKYWKMMKIISFIFVSNFLFLFKIYIIFCFREFTDIVIDWIILSRKFLANETLMSFSSFLNSLNFDSFIILTTEESSLNFSSYSFYCTLSKFLTQSSFSVYESSLQLLFSSVSPS